MKSIYLVGAMQVYGEKAKKQKNGETKLKNIFQNILLILIASLLRIIMNMAATIISLIVKSCALICERLEKQISCS